MITYNFDEICMIFTPKLQILLNILPTKSKRCRHNCRPTCMLRGSMALQSALGSGWGGGGGGGVSSLGETGDWKIGWGGRFTTSGVAYVELSVNTVTSMIQHQLGGYLDCMGSFMQSTFPIHRFLLNIESTQDIQIQCLKTWWLWRLYRSQECRYTTWNCA